MYITVYSSCTLACLVFFYYLLFFLHVYIWNGNAVYNVNHFLV